MPKVSVIVPVYNTEKYLKDCLNSLVNQTLKDIEIIIINDGSTDKSLELLNDYASKYKNIIIINKKNEGQAIARNLGIKSANGEYIAFVDSDDYIELNMFEELYKDSEKKYDIVMCNFYKTFENYEEKGMIETFADNDNVLPQEYAITSPGPCNKIYKTSFLKNNNFKFPEGIIYEDYASIPILAKYKPLIKYVDIAYLHYRQSQISTMRNLKYKVKYEDIFLATNYLYDNLIDCDFNSELEFIIIYHFLYLGALNFYKYKKYDKINEISDFINLKFKNWYKNKYINRLTFKEKVLSYLFYKKKYKLISFIQRLKSGV